MKRFPLFLICIASAIAEPPGIDQSMEFVSPPTGGKFIRWHGKPGRSYFLQVSDPADHLNKWKWAPIIEGGNDEEISYDIDGTAEKGFFRLKYADQVPGPYETLDTADFDNDGLSNIDEVSPPQAAMAMRGVIPAFVPNATDPLNSDTDGDGLPDGWEKANGLDANDSTGENGADGDPDHDGLTNAQELEAGTAPNNADTDGDGISDGGEVDQNTDPSDPTSTPDAEWVILSGDLEQGMQKTKSRTIIIPAGQKRLVITAVASEEYPDWTGPQSEYNDILTWNIQPASGQSLSGNLDVNSRNDEWAAAEQAGYSLNGFTPTHIEKIQVYEAPSDAALTIQITLTATNIADEKLPSTVMVGLVPITMEYMAPDDPNWETILSEDRVVLRDENTRIRIQIKGIELSSPKLDDIGISEIHLNTSITRAGLPDVIVPINDPACSVISANTNTEIRYELTLNDLKRLELLPSPGDNNLANYSTSDQGIGPGSNFTDSQAFIDRMTAGLRGIPAGYANNKPNVNLSSNPPQSQLHKSFIKAAGCEVISAKLGSSIKLRTVMNQSEIFYYSGHGTPGNRITGPALSFSEFEQIDGNEFKPYWNENLHIAIIAGCSVVNVNNLNPNPGTYNPPTIGPSTGYYSGEFMNTCGPRFILGYGSTAPHDTQNSDGIITSFVDAYIADPLNPFLHWANANDNPNGRNATAIDKNSKFGYFERVIILGVTVNYVWNTIDFENW